MAAFVIDKLCRGCQRCVRACPNKAIAMEMSLAVVDPQKCMDCEACMEVCMHGAITSIEEPEKQSAILNTSHFTNT